MRALVLLVAAVLLAACGSTPAAGPSPASLAVSPAAVSPPSVATSPRTTSGHRAVREPVLLPRPCTPADRVRIAGLTHDAATAMRFEIWKLRSAAPCTLFGQARVALFGADGARVAATRRPWSSGSRQAAPAVVGPHAVATVAARIQRCDEAVTGRATRVELTLPGDLGSIDGPADIDLCPAEHPLDLQVAPLGRWRLTSAPTRASAARIGSGFVRGGDSTWGRADVDGDGRPDVVLLTGRGRLEVRLATGRTLTRTVPTWGRLQAFVDLDGDGAAEVLVGYTALGCGGGYAFCDSAPVVLTLHGGALDRVRMRLHFDDGQGDLYAGVRCRGNTVTQVSVLDDGAAALRVRRVIWRLSGGRATRIAVARDREPGDPLELAASHCPGLGADGWAE